MGTDWNNILPVCGLNILGRILFQQGSYTSVNDLTCDWKFLAAAANFKPSIDTIMLIWIGSYHALISGRTVYLQLPELGIELADDHDGANAVEWATWNNVAVRIAGHPLASKLRIYSYILHW